MELFYKAIFYIATPILPIIAKIEMKFLPTLLWRYSLITSIIICIIIVFSPILLLFFLLSNTILKSVDKEYMRFIFLIIIVYGFVFGYVMYVPESVRAVYLK